MVLTRIFLAVLCLAGCTYVPFDAPRSKSSFIAEPVSQLDLGLADPSGGQSAFVALSDGNDALGARLRMIEAAQTSIDIKTFLIKPDTAGSLFAVELYRAAERGVRVRLLVDDAFTTVRDSGLGTLDAHPNIELRIFNPLSRRSIAAVNYLFDFGRVNRRMHNKAFIVDGQAAIIGGRNIADEYYQIDTSSEFADFDLFLAGPAVADLGGAFDLYWSDQWSVPVAALHGIESDTALAEAVAAFEATAEGPEAEIYRRAVDSTYLRDLRTGKIEPFFGTAQTVVDPPSKLRARQGGTDQETAIALMTAMDRANKEITLITPYFVPEDYGTAFFADLAQRGIKIRVVTNSLAATNHPYVHSGYAPRRDALLGAGVELYEVRADALKDLPPSDPASGIGLTMHTKAALIDDDLTFIGSMNWDPRSIKLNSEIGMLIRSPEMNRALRKSIDSRLSDFTYKVGTDGDGRITWDRMSDGQTLRYFSEPGAGFWSRFLAVGAGLLPIEGQL